LGNLYREVIQVGISRAEIPVVSLAEIPARGISTADKIFSLINNLTILTATRIGKFGADSMNSMAEEILHKLSIIDPVERFYPGRPIMVMRNDYALSLFNGDMGVVSDKSDVIFKDTEDGSRSIHISRLPEHETAFAMTIHKSQGSEFNNVLIVLPDSMNTVMTRELLYTAVTRAKNGVILATGKDIIKEIVLTPTKRMSGLKEKLWV
jgi:exodeoxyribonuclease V alpha subunit